MPRIAYVPKVFRAEHMDIIQKANQIAADFSARGFNLTLRQLYYQFVGRGWLPNVDAQYKRLGGIINDARLAGEMDWNYISDRTRNLVGTFYGYEDPADVIDAAAFSVALWEGQGYRPEVWVEKDALIGVIGTAVRPFRLPHFACRGYTSQSEVWGAAMRMVEYRRQGLTPVIFHLGDHDPSGIDMTRDIRDRLALFCWHHGYEPPEVKRLALNMDQIEEYDPPPNPAKVTDARFASYEAEYGEESWELDALDPDVIVTLIRDNIRPLIDKDAWDGMKEKEAKGRATLEAIREHYDSVIEHLDAEGLLPEVEVSDDEDDDESIDDDPDA